MTRGLSDAEREARAAAWRSLAGRDYELDQGEVGDTLWSAGVEYARGETVVLLRSDDLYYGLGLKPGQHELVLEVADWIEARFSPALEQSGGGS